jgi:hypothetical protein
MVARLLFGRVGATCYIFLPFKDNVSDRATRFNFDTSFDYVPTHAKQVAGCRRQSKQRNSRRLATIRRSIGRKLVECVFEPMHRSFDFTLERCADDEGQNSHGDSSHCCSPSDYALERDFGEERVFFNPPWELA